MKGKISTGENVQYCYKKLKIKLKWAGGTQEKSKLFFIVGANVNNKAIMENIMFYILEIELSDDSVI